MAAQHLKLGINMNRAISFFYWALLVLAVLCVSGCLHADIGNMRR